MNKTIAAAAIAAALTLGAPQAMAADDTNKMDDTTKMETGEKGMPAGQPAGTETSDRTPGEATPTPDAQVDQTKEGETSDRTPEAK